MVVSKTGLVNLVFSRLGLPSVVNIDTDTTDRGEDARLHYTSAYEELIVESKVKFATTQQALTLVTDTATTEGYYEHYKPSDFLQLIRVVTDNTYITPKDNNKFWATTKGPLIEYISNNALNTPSLWPIKFRQAFEARLAARLGNIYAPDNQRIQAWFNESVSALASAAHNDSTSATESRYTGTMWDGTSWQSHYGVGL